MRWDPQDAKWRDLLSEPGDDEDEEEEGEESSSSDDDERIAEKVLKTRTVLVSEAISDELARKIYQQLLILESESREKPITVMINSPGGEADSGFGIYDMLRFVAAPVRTIVAGLCASAAILVFLAGEEKQRLSLPHSRFMMHQPSSQSFGQASDLAIASTEIIKLRERYNKIVAEATHQDIDRVRRDVDRDFWLTAGEAQEYGLVDRVIERRVEIDPS